MKNELVTCWWSQYQQQVVVKSTVVHRYSHVLQQNNTSNIVRVSFTITWFCYSCIFRLLWLWSLFGFQSVCKCEWVSVCVCESVWAAVSSSPFHDCCSSLEDDNGWDKEWSRDKLHGIHDAVRRDVPSFQRGKTFGAVNWNWKLLPAEHSAVGWDT